MKMSLKGSDIWLGKYDPIHLHFRLVVKILKLVCQYPIGAYFIDNIVVQLEQFFLHSSLKIKYLEHNERYRTLCMNATGQL